MLDRHRHAVHRHDALHVQSEFADTLVHDDGINARNHEFRCQHIEEIGHVEQFLSREIGNENLLDMG